MNGNTGGSCSRPRSRRRAGVLAAPVAGIALLVAACGGGSSATAGSSTFQTAYQKAIAYAQCMRSRGEPRFPDPDSQGNFELTGPEVGPINSPLYLSANKACEHLLPNGGRQIPLTAAQQQKLLSAALRWAECMRSHGYPSFQDPTLLDGNVGQRLPAGVDQLSPQFKSASQACQKVDPFPPSPSGAP